MPFSRRPADGPGSRPGTRNRSGVLSGVYWLPEDALRCMHCRSSPISGEPWSEDPAARPGPGVSGSTPVFGEPWPLHGMPPFSNSGETSCGGRMRPGFPGRRACCHGAILNPGKLRLPRRLSAAFRGGSLKAADRYQFTSPAFCCSHPESEGNTVFIDTDSRSRANIGLTMPIHSLKCGASRWAWNASSSR